MRRHPQLWRPQRTRPRRGSLDMARQLVHLADESGDEARCGLGVDVLRATDLFDTALAHHHDAIGDRQRLLLVVCDVQRRHAQRSLIRRISSRKFTRTTASSALSGSSSSSIRGSMASARASAMRCCCPPLSSRGYLAAASSSPTSASNSGTRRRTSVAGRAAIRIPKAMFFQAVR